MSIDYFDHKYYNSLQPCLWCHITNAKIALLPDVSLSFSGTADKKLTNNNFNDKYGAQVLAKYSLVNDINNTNDTDREDIWLVDGNDANMLKDNVYDNNVDEDGTAKSNMLMSARQNTLTAQLL